MSQAHALIVEAVRAGVLLYVEGDALRFKARLSMPVDLARRIRTHRGDLLALLAATDAPATPRPINAPATPRAVYAPAERQRLRAADIRPGNVAPMADALKSIFTDAEVIHAERTQPAPRRRMAGYIRAARHHGERGRAVALRDSWRERMAVCTIDGGLSEAQAELLAIDEAAPPGGGYGKKLGCG